MSWPLVTLGSLEGGKGNFVDGPFGSNLKSSEYTETGVPLIQLKNIKPNKYITKDLKFVSQEKADSISRHSYKAGDVCIAKLGAVGTACIIPEDAPDGIIVADVVRFRGDKALIDYKYFCHYLNSPVGQRNILKLSRGSTRTRTNLTDLKTVEIPLPPLDEQKRIAAILDKADNIRRKRQQAIKLADDFLRSVFLDMFGDPVTNPKGWEDCNIEGLMSEGIVNGLHASKDRLGSGVSLIDNKALYKGLIVDLAEHRKVNLSEKELKKYELNKDDILFNRVSVAPEGVGKSCLVNSLTKITVFESNIMRVRVNKSLVSPLFLTYLLSLEGMRKVIRKKSTIANQASINQTALKSIPVYLPPLSKQKEFDKMYWSIAETKTSKLEGLSQQVQLIKSLSQKAFAGEL